MEGCYLSKSVVRVLCSSPAVRFTAWQALGFETKQTEILQCIFVILCLLTARWFCIRCMGKVRAVCLYENNAKIKTLKDVIIREAYLQCCAVQVLQPLDFNRKTNGDPTVCSL